MPLEALASLLAQFAPLAHPIPDVDQLIAELGGHEDVDDRIDARVDKWEQVEDDAQCVGDVVELLKAALDHHLHRQSRSPADEEEQNDQDEHLDDLDGGEAIIRECSGNSNGKYLKI